MPSINRFSFDTQPQHQPLQFRQRFQYNAARFSPLLPHRSRSPPQPLRTKFAAPAYFQPLLNTDSRHNTITGFPLSLSRHFALSRRRLPSPAVSAPPLFGAQVIRLRRPGIREIHRRATRYARAFGASLCSCDRHLYPGRRPALFWARIARDYLIYLD